MERNIKSLSMWMIALAVGLFALLAPLRAVADDDDPPSRVARLSYTRGSVSFEPAGTDDWVNAVLNRPITTGDKLWADDDSLAELHLGPASIRMSDHTGFSFLNLTDTTAQLQLTAGTLRIRVKRLGDNENFEIDTPNLAFSILRPGVYRIHVDEDGGATVIKVRSGEGEVTGGGSAYTVHGREAATFSGTDELIADFNTPWDDDDDFDAWCADRDRHEDRSLSRRYVSDDVVGYEDLDDYGGWRPLPGYGNVWFPQTTIVGWAPYRYGHWAYVYPWGYTWIDDAPWGFAPFHYGRWINYDGVWGWVPCPPPAPGVVYVRPVYAPALVAWVGGPHFAIGVSVGGGGGVGWFPLGPREVYVPSYPVSRTYITNVNVSNTTVNRTVINNYYNNTTVINRNTTVINNNVQIHQTYVNQTVPGAVTATTSQAFTSAQPVAKNVIRIDQRAVATAQVSSFTPAVAPGRQAVLGTGGAAAVKPPVVVQSRAVVAKETPPPPPVPFTRQQQAIQANGGKPLAISQERQIQRQIQPVTSEAVHPAVKIAPPVQNVQGGRPSQMNNPGNQPGQFSAGGGNKPANSNAGGQGQGNVGNGNKPGFVNGGQPGGNPPDNGYRRFGDRPPSGRANGDDANSGGKAGVGGNNSSNAGGGGNITRGGNGGGGNSENKPNFANGGQPGGNPPGNGNRGFGDRPPSARSNGDDVNSSGKAGVGANNSGNAGGGGSVTRGGNSVGNSDHKPNLGNGGQPGGNGPGNGNRGFGDRPPSARGSGGDAGGGNADNRGSNITPADVKHQQELEQLRIRQDQDRQRLEHQQEDQQRLARQADDERRQQELNQKHDQRLPALEPKHDSQPEKLQQKPQDDRRGDSSKEKPKDKPKDRPGENDHPRGGDHPSDRN